MWIAILFAAGFLALGSSAPSKANGINFLNGQWSPQKFNSSDAAASLALLQTSTGTSYIALTTCWFQHTVDVPGPIYPRPGISPLPDEIAAITQLAHSKGISVMIRPCVDPDWSNPNVTGTWRGQIGRYFTPSQWDTWFTSYQSYMYQFASLAQTVGADSMCVGMELTVASWQTQHWRDTVAGIRARYSGPLVYAANHGNELKVQWWDAVDIIGVDAYYPLATSTYTPTLDELVSAWSPIVDELEGLSTQYNKPIMFNEIGYTAKTGSNISPAGYNSSAPYNETAQANLYQAFFLAVYPQPWFQGVFWWAWLTNPDDSGPNGDGFTPNGRQAAKIMKQYYTQ